MASQPLFWVAGIACMAVLVVLVLGVSTFGKQDRDSRIRSNNLMKLRLILQFGAVVAILAFVYFTQGLG